MQLPDVTVINSILSGADTAGTVETTGLGVIVRVSLDDAARVLSALKTSDLGFDFMVDLFGHDTGEAVDITYHLRSFSRDEEVYVRAEVAYDGTLPSVWEVYPAALMPERETAELLGLSLSGHPNPKRLLTTDAVGPLLRKDSAIRTGEEVRNR